MTHHSNNKNSEPSRFLIERWYLGELKNDPKKAKLIKNYVTQNPRGQSILKDIQSDQLAFEQTQPFEPFWQKISQNKKASKTNWLLGIKILVPALSILIIGLFINQQSSNQDYIGTKGSVHFGYFKLLENGEIKRGKSKETLKPGDQIRFFVNPVPKNFVAVFGIEKSGKINRYYPEQKGDAFEVTNSKGKNYHFPEAIKLDNSPHSELFIAVFSSTPKELSSIEATVIKQLNKIDFNFDNPKLSLDLPFDFFVLHKKTSAE